MKIKPLRGRVVVREIIDRRIGSIWVPDQANEKTREQKIHRGTVLAMGAPAFSARSSVAREVSPGFAVGDHVLFVFCAPCAERGRTTDWDGEPGAVWLTQEEIIGVYRAS